MPVLGAVVREARPCRVLLHAGGVQPVIGHVLLGEGPVALAAGPRGIFEYLVERECISVVTDCVLPDQRIRERLDVVGQRLVVDPVGPGPDTVRDLAPRVQGPVPQHGCVPPREHDLDELTVILREELLRDPRRLEPPSVRPYRRPHGAQGVNEGEALDSVRVIDCGLERDDAAPVVANECAALDPLGIEVVDDVLGEQCPTHTGARLVRAAESPVVRRVSRVPGVGQCGQLVTPLITGLRKPVEQYHRMAVRWARDPLVHPEVNGLDELRFDPHTGEHYVRRRQRGPER
ncbi:unannotated protein [freshwater metagenome]|uniref:Unannotated protein n=1 Tax=freshwater metagenome TaxID=449393 RepID=A0A6J6ZNJ4_9ZZZZ